jgi:hypothetical protein
MLKELRQLVATAKGTSSTAKTLTYLVKAVATAGTGVALAATATPAIIAYVKAKRAGAANTGKVYVGDSAVDKTTPQEFDLNPGESMQLPIAPGTSLDLATVYVDADTATDGVVVLYLPA